MTFGKPDKNLDPTLNRLKYRARHRFEGSVMMQVKELVDEWNDLPYDKWDEGPYKRDEGAEWAGFHREDFMLDFTYVKARYKILTHREIAEAWAMRDGIATTYETYVELKNHYERMIIQAIFAGEIVAEEVSRKFTEDGVWEIIQNTPVGLNNLERDLDLAADMGEDCYLDIRFSLSRGAFRSWLEADQNRWPLSDNCLLNKWFEHPESKSQVNVDDEENQVYTPTGRKENELKQGIREIWENENRPETKNFFPGIMKKFIDTKGSPIRAVYPSGKDAGFDYELSTGATGYKTKKTLGNWLSDWRNETP
jgi:hypothetical protein